ncbi:hypothetical protein AB0D42_38405 [Streptomyces sp. NPDC048304]|uniref:hypothetical protein n=1 Tax=Streptomyces sp. NPDC048304 TaxID=3154820 RepID=UPI003404F85C
MLLTGDEVDAEGFIDLAHTCGARVLYFDSVVFAADEFAVLDDDGADPESSVEDELSPEAQKELKRLRRAARTHAGKTTVVVMCFVAEGLPHYWSEEAAWHTDLQDAWAEFTEHNRLSAQERAQDARQRADAEAERIAAELADNPEFRAATKRTHRHGVADSVCPPPVGADDEELQEHQRIVRWATNRAIDLVEEASRRIYAGYERDLEALADEIVQHTVLADATTVAARTLLVGEFLTVKSGGYPPPKRFMDLLMLKPQLRRRQKTQTPKAELLPLE